MLAMICRKMCALIASWKRAEWLKIRKSTAYQCVTAFVDLYSRKSHFRFAYERTQVRMAFKDQTDNFYDASEKWFLFFLCSNIDKCTSTRTTKSEESMQSIFTWSQEKRKHWKALGLGCLFTMNLPCVDDSMNGFKFMSMNFDGNIFTIFSLYLALLVRNLSTCECVEKQTAASPAFGRRKKHFSFSHIDLSQVDNIRCARCFFFWLVFVVSAVSVADKNGHKLFSLPFCFISVFHLAFRVRSSDSKHNFCFRHDENCLLIKIDEKSTAQYLRQNIAFFHSFSLSLSTPSNNIWFSLKNETNAWCIVYIAWSNDNGKIFFGCFV